MKFYANVLRCQPYYEKDKSGKKTDVVKGHVMEIMEVKQSLDGSPYVVMSTIFPDVTALAVDDARDFGLFDLAEIELELIDSRGRTRVCSVTACAGKSEMSVPVMLALGV